MDLHNYINNGTATITIILVSNGGFSAGVVIATYQYSDQINFINTLFFLY